MKKFVIVSVLAIIAVFGVFLGSGGSSDLEGIDIEIFMSASCGCCRFYSDYLKSKGAGMTVNTVSNSELSEIKSSMGIPINMQSCHTLKVGNYFVEGHVPKEAIMKLIEEKPDIDGIALPGMPSGSPGMSGTRKGEFTIYSITNGKVSEFTRI
ncbi:MAG: hypothetical protein GOV01_00725 [Candidatus Altiarchaeota archaeon]|nr:hypothetical protein [Candidatus Altiarchaeota archaeon]